jgi:hypothetical protein
VPRCATGSQLRSAKDNLTTLLDLHFPTSAANAIGFSYQYAGGNMHRRSTQPPEGFLTVCHIQPRVVGQGEISRGLTDLRCISTSCQRTLDAGYEESDVERKQLTPRPCNNNPVTTITDQAPCILARWSVLLSDCLRKSYMYTSSRDQPC